MLIHSAMFSALTMCICPAMKATYLQMPPFFLICCPRLPHHYYWASSQFYKRSNPGCLFPWQQKTPKLKWAILICTFYHLPKVTQANWSGVKLPRVLSISLFFCRWSAGGLLVLCAVCVFPKCLLERKLSWNKNWHSMAKRKLITEKSHFPLAQLF